jgi:hypothetical protein
LGENKPLKFVIWIIGVQVTKMALYKKKFYEDANAAFIVIDKTH